MSERSLRPAWAWLWIWLAALLLLAAAAMVTVIALSNDDRSEVLLLLLLLVFISGPALLGVFALGTLALIMARPSGGRWRAFRRWGLALLGSAALLTGLAFVTDDAGSAVLLIVPGASALAFLWLDIRRGEGRGVTHIARPETDEIGDLQRFGLAIQGMAICHVVLATVLLSLFVPISVTQGGLPGLAGVAFVVITGSALFVGIAFAGLAWLLLRGDFLPLRWALILPGGLGGTIVAILTGVINPISEGLGLLVAYYLVGRSLRRRRGAPVDHD